MVAPPPPLAKVAKYGKRARVNLEAVYADTSLAISKLYIDS